MPPLVFNHIDVGEEVGRDVLDIIDRHTPRRPELDEGSEIVCDGHRGGYPPKWPCRERRLAEALIMMESKMSRLVDKTPEPVFTGNDREDLKEVLRSYGWSPTHEFLVKYHNDPWVFNLANALLREHRKYDSLAKKVRVVT